MPPNQTGSRRGRNGAVAVEMAIVLPVIFLLVLGAIEFGRAVMVTNVMTAAAREGARSGIVPNASNSEVTSAVRSMLRSSGLPDSRATITIKVNGSVRDVTTAVNGDSISVRVTLPYGDVTWLPRPFFIASTTELGGEAVMRHE